MPGGYLLDRGLQVESDITQFHRLALQPLQNSLPETTTLKGGVYSYPFDLGRLPRDSLEGSHGDDVPVQDAY